ncbi:MAG TPA: thiamine phosphate synthase, partial [Planctomycetaceae bacterium]|nr:thiamine phosphate synthase [Planctomycetaceae bacterium]
ARTTPRLSPELTRVLDVAQKSARRGRPAAEIGTEHLLWGLVNVDSGAREFLRARGLTDATLPDFLSEGEQTVGAPLAVDVELKRPDEQRLERTALLRMLDAAANRAGEGLRVIEDFARFALDDIHLTEELKALRHELTDVLRIIPADERLAARDTQADVGTTVTTPSESERASVADIVRSNFKRLQESLRTLEECSKRAQELWEAAKNVSPAAVLKLSERLEQIRYRVYTLEKAVLGTQHSRERLAECSLCLLATSSLCRQGLERVVRESLDAGVSMIQLREKELPDCEVLRLARDVRQWTRRRGALFIVNDRPDIALLADADGVHVGQDDLSVYDARRIVGPDRLVGLSTHSIGQARQAVLEGAVYLGVGPVFSSSTKQFENLAGLELVRQVAAEITRPWFAIGGIGPENLDALRAAGAVRIAVSAAICRAQYPRDAARQLLDQLEGATNDAI